MANDDNTPPPFADSLQDRRVARLILRILFMTLAIVATLWLVHGLRIILLLLILSIFFSYLIAPLVARLEGPVLIKGHRRRLPRAAAIATVYLSLALLITLLIYNVLPALTAQIHAFTRHLPDYTAQAIFYFEKLDLLYRNQNLPVEWQKATSSAITQIGDNLLKWLKGGLVGALGLAAFLPWLILVPILAFFILKDAEIFRQAVISAFPTPLLRQRMEALFLEASETLTAYIRAQLLACVIVGVVCSAGFKLLGTPYPLVLGVGAGILEFIPLAGPLFTAAAAIFVSATVSFKVALSVLVFLLVLRVIEDYVIYPRLLGHGLEMHPLTIILSVLSGAELGGVLGIFLAVPAVALMMVFYKHWIEYKGHRGLMADQLQPTVELKPSPSIPHAQELRNDPSRAASEKRG